LNSEATEKTKRKRRERSASKTSRGGLSNNVARTCKTTRVGRYYFIQPGKESHGGAEKDTVTESAIVAQAVIHFRQTLRIAGREKWE